MIRFLCFLYSSNLLIEPVRLYVLKREFLLFIALSNIGESQGRCFLGGSRFAANSLSALIELPMECRTEEKLCTGFPRSPNDRQVAIVVYHLVSTPIDNIYCGQALLCACEASILHARTIVVN